MCGRNVRLYLSSCRQSLIGHSEFINFYGSDIYLSEIKPGGAEHLIWRVRLRLQTEGEIAQAYAEAEKLIQDVEEWRKWYNTITDEERKFTFISESASASEPEDSGSGSSATDSSSDLGPGNTTSDKSNMS